VGKVGKTGGRTEDVGTTRTERKKGHKTIGKALRKDPGKNSGSGNHGGKGAPVLMQAIVGGTTSKRSKKEVEKRKWKGQILLELASARSQPAKTGGQKQSNYKKKSATWPQTWHTERVVYAAEKNRPIEKTIRKMGQAPRGNSRGRSSFLPGPKTLHPVPGGVTSGLKMRAIGCQGKKVGAPRTRHEHQNNRERPAPLGNVKPKCRWRK